MADQDDDDFGFDDDDLDGLPANALEHLEANAFRATQQPQPQPQPLAESDYGLDDGEEVVNLNDDSALPRASPWVVTAPVPQHTHTQRDYTHDYDYGYDYQQNGRDNGSNDNENYADTAGPDDYGQGGAGANSQIDYVNVQEPPRPSQADPNQLLQRIKKLEQEKACQRKEAEELKDKLQTKAGEADTLRRRHDAESRRYERQLADQQNQHGSELAKLRAEMDKLRCEAESAQTDSMFNQYEAREAGLPRRTARIVPSRPRPAPPPVSPVGTPRREQKIRGPLGDGFDDDEMVMASPSKHRDKSKTATPRQAGKRKRQAIDQSPVPLPALQLSEPRGRPKEREQAPVAAFKMDAALLQHFRREDRRFSLLHRLLSHPSSKDTGRVLESLTKYAFPSNTAKKLSSIVYDALANTAPNDVHDLALHMCHVFLDLWKRCHNEKYYAPTSLIVDALHFVLACEPVETAVKITERVVPLIIASVDLVADPISKAAKGGDKAIADLYSSKQRQIAASIHAEDCLELLYLVASSCLSSSDPGVIVRLWQAIPSSFAIMLLVKEQPLAQIKLMLRILGTSVLPTSVGPIMPGDPVPESQANNEDALINRLTNLFTERPKPVPDPTLPANSILPVSDADLLHLRLLVLSVLAQFSVSEHGSSRLAQNRLCIGRLIKYLDHCITSLYRQPIATTQVYKVDSINATMKLIYHVATSNPDFDMKSKLVNTLGGQHAYLVALTRLAFSEGLLLEAGIQDEVVNMAHDILDEGLSMEEGDAFGKVFSSASAA